MPEQLPTSFWPEPVLPPSVERDPFEAAAITNRRKFKNLPAAGSSNLGTVAESLAPTEPWEYALALAFPGQSLIGRGIGAIPKGLRAAGAAATAFMTPSEAEASPYAKVSGYAEQLAKFLGGSSRIDPRLASPVSGIKLNKPLEEMAHGFSDIRSPVPQFVDPQKMVGGNLILTPGDISRGNRKITHIDDWKLDRAVEAQGGVSFPEANPGMAWASEAPIARKLDNQAAKAAAEGRPSYIAPFTMSPQTSMDASHHIYDPISQLVQRSPIKATDAEAFDNLMRGHAAELKRDWTSIRDPGFQQWLGELEGGMKLKSAMAQEMAKSEWQKKGFPNIAAIRHAMAEPGLIDVPRYTTGMAISQYKPGQGLLDTAHRSYSKGVAGDYMGQWPSLVPFHIAAPDMAKAIEARNVANIAAGKKTLINPRSFLEKPPAGMPTHQELTPEWLDGIMKYFEAQKSGY